MSINPKIFKAYDIRGIYPDEINEEAGKKIGAAFAKFFGDKTDNFFVGRDARLSSPALFEALAKGITSQGKNVLDIGTCTNPMLIFAVKKTPKSAGVMVSASHSPWQYNAFKLNAPRGIQMSDEKYDPIKEMALKGDFIQAEKAGTIEKRSILGEYIAHILEYASKDLNKLKVVVDYGNGVGAVSAKPVFEKLSIEAISLYEEPDGRFPNHPADPHNIENMEELRRRVVAEKADLGIFFDGDADRGIIIDEKGEIVFADLMVALLAQEELKKFPGEKVYYDLRFSKVVKEIVEANGGKPVMMRVGNPFYKEKMEFEGGAVAGEFSGHIFTREGMGIDDGLFAAIKIMNIIVARGKKLSELIAPLKKYFATEEINIKVADADAALKKVAEYFKDGRSIDLDGVYIEYPDWWFSLRKSNTEPVVRLRVEANTKELMEEKKKELVELITNN
jgi:phosphomannomutase